ncbi:hypothetical protein BD410DRAFT_779140, partial [Rickenella mellea]
MYVSHVKAWGDDVSGNRSKQYNAHMNIYFAHANLPHEKLSQEYFVQFCSTSPHATSAEQFNAFASQINSSGKWFNAYDAEDNCEILFRVLVHNLPADNPQQSDTASHIGLNSNHFCRRCHVGGSEEYKVSDEGYSSLFSVGRLRNHDETRECIRQQLMAACLGVKEPVEKLQQLSGVKDKTAQRWIDLLIVRAHELHKSRITEPQTRDPRLSDRSIKGDDWKAIIQAIKESIQAELFEWLLTQPQQYYDALPMDSPLRHQLRPGQHYNALLDLDALDVHHDSPVENLHTYLLGQDKYVWHLTNKAWTKDEGDLFATRLQCSSRYGLNIPPIHASYMIQYKNGLIGKHFRILQQLGAFHLHGGLVPDMVFELWKATGELGALLWYHEISDMESYLADLKILINNVLDIWAHIDYARIIDKPKLHILLHILDDILLFGPVPLFSTEIFECYNAIFRLCSVFSNHQAPGRDIAVTLADMARFKHVASGGWWKTEDGEYVRAGIEVRKYFEMDKTFQRRLGWSAPETLIPGCVIAMTGKKARPRPWRETKSSEFTPEDVDYDLIWSDGASVISKSRDVCQPGSWVFFDCMVSLSADRIRAGRILEILIPDSKSFREPRISIEEFNVSPVCHTTFNMPSLTRPQGTVVVHLIDAKDIQFIFNVQHNCRDRGCAASGTRSQHQERRETTATIAVIEHNDDDYFIVNMHALHNAALLRQTLPRELTKPKEFSTDRESTILNIAAAARPKQAAKRAQTNAKAKATREKNKENQLKYSQPSGSGVQAAADDIEAVLEDEGIYIDQSLDAPPHTASM